MSIELNSYKKSSALANYKDDNYVYYYDIISG